MAVKLDLARSRTNSAWTKLVTMELLWFPKLVKIMAVCAVLSVTNPGALDRILLQLAAPNYPAFIVHLVVWLVAGFALWSIMFERSWGWRLCGSVLVAASTALSWGFRSISKIELSVFDGMSLWRRAMKRLMPRPSIRARLCSASFCFSWWR